jgi:uncharacterized protein YjbI with pentapeptide repeats
MECEFIECNLSNANLVGTMFKEVSFTHCKMTGLKFEDCNDFLLSFTFDHCILNLSSFYQLQLKKQYFRSCKFNEADFTESELTAAVFEDCDLQNALFERSVLEQADFSTARNFKIDPERNRLKKAKFSKDGVVGLLGKYDIVIE